MLFEIDVSGEDIFSSDYTIVVADKNSLIKGFKFNRDLIEKLRFKHAQGEYRYADSQQGKALLKVRVYCIIIHYLFKNIDFRHSNREANIEICKDFQGHEKDITSNLNYFLGDLLKLKTAIRYTKLSKESNADKYAYLMRKDTKNQMKGYVKISLEEIENFLKKQR
jgi:hypothetical protein